MQDFDGRPVDPITDELQTRAYVRRFIERELEDLEDLREGGEPDVTFSVKLPVTDMAKLERIGSYLGYKKTPFASMLLQQAIEDAWWGLLLAAEDHGKREEVASYLQERHELEDGSGTVGPMHGGV